MVVDDHRVVRSGLACCFEYRTGDIRVVGGCGRGDQVVQVARQIAPDVVLMNRNMRDGWAATRALTAALPDCRVIFFSAMGAGPGDYDRARDVGAVGYLRKAVEVDVLADHVRRVAAGGAAWPPLSD